MADHRGVRRLGCCAFALPLRDIAIDPEIKNQLPPDMPARRNVRAIEQKFGGSELVMIVVEAHDVLAPRTLERIQKLSRGARRRSRRSSA